MNRSVRMRCNFDQHDPIYAWARLAVTDIIARHGQSNLAATMSIVLQEKDDLVDAMIRNGLSWDIFSSLDYLKGVLSE